MKKPTFAQMQAEQTKTRLTEILTDQIEKLVNSRVFEADEIFDIFQKATAQRNAYITEKEFISACQAAISRKGGFIIDEMNYMQEIALKDFCKENDIKLLEF